MADRKYPGVTAWFLTSVLLFIPVLNLLYLMYLVWTEPKNQAACERQQFYKLAMIPVMAVTMFGIVLILGWVFLVGIT